MTVGADEDLAMAAASCAVEDEVEISRAWPQPAVARASKGKSVEKKQRMLRTTYWTVDVEMMCAAGCACHSATLRAWGRGPKSVEGPRRRWLGRFGHGA